MQISWGAFLKDQWIAENIAVVAENIAVAHELVNKIKNHQGKKRFDGC